MDGELEDRPAKPVSNLVLKIQVTSQKNEKLAVKGIKCACRKSWCPSCGQKISVARFSEKISKWDWERVRQVILTVDPNLYPDPETALKTINKKKHIANAIRNLERTKGIKIENFQWVLESYRNGFPHWHVFILVKKAGREGMIGGDNLRCYWKSGRVTESYIRNENHWKKITGYFQKHGHFNKAKAHQARLPDWAREKTYVIRRTGGKTNPKGNMNYVGKEKFLEFEENKENPRMQKLVELSNAVEIGEWFLSQTCEKEWKTEGEKLDACGCETDLYLGCGVKYYLGRAKMPYKVFRSLKGEYVKGVGYLVELDINQLDDFIKIIDFPLIGKVHDYLNRTTNSQFI